MKLDAPSGNCLRCRRLHGSLRYAGDACPRRFEDATFTRCPETFPDDLDAIGVATSLRAMPPAEGLATMERIAPRIASIAPRITHYKVCSTFDSARETGNIAVVSDLLASTIGAHWIAIVGGQPSLRRYCVFATLYAAAGDGAVHRIDRHPVMKAHPTTPMAEADLRRHLALQGWPDIGLIDYRSYAIAADLRASLASRLETGERITLFDVSASEDLAVVGQAIRERSKGQSVLCIGASSVAEAMLASAGSRKVSRPKFDSPGFEGPILAISGSRSATTKAQIEASQSYSKAWAKAADFVPNAPERAALMKEGVRILGSGRNLLVAVSEERHGEIPASRLSRILADFAAELIERTSPACLFVAGGDTSSALVSALDVESLEFVRDIDRGVPLVGATSAGTAGGLAMVLKGGQMGQLDVFELRGHARYVARDRSSRLSETIYRLLRRSTSTATSTTAPMTPKVWSDVVV